MTYRTTFLLKSKVKLLKYRTEKRNKKGSLAQKKEPKRGSRKQKNLGNVLSSHTLLSALKGLTSVFGMGTGVPPSLSSPRKLYFIKIVLSKLR